MFDPHEGLDEGGSIRTGASIDRIPERYRPVLEAAVDAVMAVNPDASVYLYGSVATGQAVSPLSDVDLLAVGLAPADAAGIAAELSLSSRDLSRGVEIATGSPSDFMGDSDESYGARVFLHHYCVRLAGRDLDRARSAFPGDRRAARGFNGDIDRHVRVWRRDAGTVDAAELGRRAARKTLLAVAGLVSVHDRTWITDRASAAHRWSEIHPELEHGLNRLLSWSFGVDMADRSDLQRELAGTFATIAHQFADEIGLWDAAS